MLLQKWWSTIRGFTKYNYKTNREIENLEILSHVGKPLEVIFLKWWFQNKKVKNLPKSSKNIGNFISFFMEIKNLGILLHVAKPIKVI
jgi:hypothetical protein